MTVSTNTPDLSLQAVERLREALEPYKDHHGPLPDYDSPVAGVFDAGVQYAVELLAKQLGVKDWTPCDGTEEYDGDLGGTLMNIVREAMPFDQHGERMWPSEVRAALEATPSLHPEGEGLTIPEGMKAWAGSDDGAPPDDWDGGPVLCRDSQMLQPTEGAWDSDGDAWDYIAYAPKPAEGTVPDDGWVMVPREKLQDLADLRKHIHQHDPDRVKWEGEWHYGPLATAYIATIEAIADAADSLLLAASPKPTIVEASGMVIEQCAREAEAFADFVAGMKSHPHPLPIDTNEGWQRVEDGARDIADRIRRLSASSPSSEQGRG